MVGAGHVLQLACAAGEVLGEETALAMPPLVVDNRAVVVAQPPITNRTTITTPRIHFGAFGFLFITKPLLRFSVMKRNCQVQWYLDHSKQFRFNTGTLLPVCAVINSAGIPSAM